MEAALVKALQILASYGPGFVVAAIFIILYLMERKKSEQMAEKLTELSVESIKADLEHTRAFDSLEKVFNSAIQALSSRR
jgi:hypothetical protein